MNCNPEQARGSPSERKEARVARDADVVMVAPRSATSTNGMMYDERKNKRRCPRSKKGIKWFPVLFAWTVVLWSYYAYVVQVCMFTIEDTFLKVALLIFYHIICIPFFWSYSASIFTPAASVPINWRVSEFELEQLLRADHPEVEKRISDLCFKDFPVTMCNLDGSVRFCVNCKAVKPDRAHHCRVCGRCILKMDHHCAWLNNCVNFSNYKYFVLLLGYAGLYWLYVAVTSLQSFIDLWRYGFYQQGEPSCGLGQLHIMFLFFASVTYSFISICLFGHHICLVLVNRTTLEACRASIFRVAGATKSGFDLGKYANFQQVFGSNWKLWFLPVFSSLGDGCQYPTAQEKQRNDQNFQAMCEAHVTRLERPPTFSNQYQNGLIGDSRRHGGGGDELSIDTAIATVGTRGGDVVININGTSSAVMDQPHMVDLQHKSIQQCQQHMNRNKFETI